MNLFELTFLVSPFLGLTGALIGIHDIDSLSGWQTAVAAVLGFAIGCCGMPFARGCIYIGEKILGKGLSNWLSDGPQSIVILIPFVVAPYLVACLSWFIFS